MSATSHNRLAALAADIRAAQADIGTCAEKMAERALAAGRALIEAKETLPHGKWESWLAGHVGMSARTARRYMQMVKADLKMAAVAELGIRGASAALARKTCRIERIAGDPAYQEWAAEMQTLLAAASPAARESFWRRAREQACAEAAAKVFRDHLASDQVRKLAGNFLRWPTFKHELSRALTAPIDAGRRA